MGSPTLESSGAGSTGYCHSDPEPATHRAARQRNPCIVTLSH